jgi:hypothetical protein
MLEPWRTVVRVWLRGTDEPVVEVGAAVVVVSAGRGTGFVLVAGSVSVLSVVAGSVVVVGDVVPVVVTVLVGSVVLGGSSARAAVATPLPKRITIANSGTSFVRTTIDGLLGAGVIQAQLPTRLHDRRLSTAQREPLCQIRSKDRACRSPAGRMEGAVASC